MKFDDYAGSISVDLSHLHTFLDSWFRPDDLVTLVGMTTSGVRRILSDVVTIDNLMGATVENFNGLLTIDDIKVNMYIGTNPTKEDHNVGIGKSRGTEEDVRAIYGCFVDLDVVKAGKKTGVFESKEDILAFLEGFPLRPTMVIDNGSNGGIHAYWRLIDEDVPKASKTLLAMWWAYVSEHAPVKIDRLIDTARILRLPSGIYWPKDAADKFDSVRVVYADGPRYSLDQLQGVTVPAYEKYLQKNMELKMQKTRTNVDLWNQRLAQRFESDPSKAGREFSEFQFKLINQLIENYLRDEVEWYEVLEPYGWTQLKVKDDGEETWARPGKSERSAVVNYVDGVGKVSGAMSLLSSSAETGLSDLKDAGVPLTKMQIMLRLKYDDDVNLMVDDLYEKVVK